VQLNAPPTRKFSNNGKIVFDPAAFQLIFPQKMLIVGMETGETGLEAML